MVREFLRYYFLSAAGIFKNPSAGIHVLNGHFISRRDLSADIFFRLLEDLRKHVQFIRIEEAASLISKKAITREKLIAFSFDDGFEECYTKIAPVLEEFKTNAAFFINPAFVEGNAAYIKNFLKEKVLTEDKRPMSWNQIIDLYKRGHIIGSHTVDHIRLNTENDEELFFQIKESKKIIEKIIAGPCDHFAYPYGQLSDLNSKALDIALENYTYIYSGTNYDRYLSFNNKVINRRHFEGDWPCSHLNYFLSKNRQYDSGN